VRLAMIRRISARFRPRRHGREPTRYFPCRHISLSNWRSCSDARRDVSVKRDFRIGASFRPFRPGNPQFHLARISGATSLLGKYERFARWESRPVIQIFDRYHFS
jgi:hypothetical protein